MRFQRYSRRQDLLVGSLGSTLLICTAVWLSNTTPMVASPPPTETTYVPQPVPLPLPDDPTPIDEPDQRPDNKRAEMRPEFPDLPRPALPNIPTQKMEPEILNPSHDPMTHIGTGGGFGTGTFTPAELDEAPSIRFQAKPQYPYSMKSQGLSGEVMVDFIVDPSGRVREVTALSSTHGEFESAAIAAVSRWKFKAGRKDGHAVFTHMQVPIDFTFDNASP